MYFVLATTCFKMLLQVIQKGLFLRNHIITISKHSRTDKIGYQERITSALKILKTVFVKQQKVYGVIGYGLVPVNA